MGIKDNIEKFRRELQPFGAQLIAVTKTHAADKIQEAYHAGQRIFGENRVQELVEKHPQLPGDIEWHLIGHLQRNKVKYIAPFVGLIQSVDSMKLLEEINKQGEKAGRVIRCLLQISIAQEETKFGLDQGTLENLMESDDIGFLKNIAIEGLMGIATLTENKAQVRDEFHKLKLLFENLKKHPLPANVIMKELSMGMSADYSMALAEGSTMIRVGTAIFGTR
jgi:pyridoxal phosphate enzyme (YggS family)